MSELHSNHLTNKKKKLTDLAVVKSLEKNIQDRTKHSQFIDIWTTSCILNNRMNPHRLTAVETFVENPQGGRCCEHSTQTKAEKRNSGHSGGAAVGPQ